jgi:hypothetical protein
MNDLSVSESNLKLCSIKSYIPSSQIETGLETTIIQKHSATNKQAATALDDVALIEQFVQGKNKLLANLNLRLDVSGNVVQLRTKKGDVIGVLKNQTTNFILVKQNSPYWEILHKVLLENSFVPLGEAEQQKGFLEYKQYEVPKGYKINYTETGALWKIWWPSQRRKNNYQIQLGLIVFTQNKWYPIQEIACVDGIFYIKTLIGEMTLGFTDKLVWLNKVEELNQPNPPLEPFSQNLETPHGYVAREMNDHQHVLEKKTMIQPLETKLEIDPELQKFLHQLKNQAIKTLANYLANGEIEVITEVIKDAKGEVTGTKTITSKKPCPEWVIEQLLNQNRL